MRRHRFSILEIKTLRSGNRPADVRHLTGGHWREVVLAMRRDLICEHCHAPFHYIFQVHEESFGAGARSTSDYAALTHAVERELRRRVRCPDCRAVQHKARHTALRREHRHNLIGLATIAGSVVGAAFLAIGGYAIAGVWGLAVGCIVAVGLMLRLVQWMVAELLN
ncbi:MAG: hypothetical protein JXA21_27975 [Anaerolineae bacterium]|nr:hypothetical protein [Anaerolineae bacterium]